MIITIDGPVCSGKSTIGRALAERLDAYYLYTGLLYRALAYLLMHKHGYTLTSIGNPDLSLVKMFLDPKRFAYSYDVTTGEHILFDGTDITAAIKNAGVDQAASIVSAHNKVREELNKIQRVLAAQQPRIIIDGRDAGSVVFAHAEYKFFLTADEQERAYRWQLQQASRGHTVSFDEALKSLRIRDQRDSQRAHAPLIIPSGAQIINTTGITVEEAVATMVRSLNLS